VSLLGSSSEKTRAMRLTPKDTQTLFAALRPLRLWWMVLDLDLKRFCVRLEEKHEAQRRK